MIRGDHRRYVRVRDILGRPDPESRIRGAFEALFGRVALYEANLKFLPASRGLVIRVNRERLDELLAVLYYLRGFVVERVSGTLKKLRELGL